MDARAAAGPALAFVAAGPDLAGARVHAQAEHLAEPVLARRREGRGRSVGSYADDLLRSDAAAVDPSVGRIVGDALGDEVLLLDREGDVDARARSERRHARAEHGRSDESTEGGADHFVKRRWAVTICQRDRTSAVRPRALTADSG